MAFVSNLCESEWTMRSENGILQCLLPVNDSTCGHQMSWSVVLSVTSVSASLKWYAGFHGSWPSSNHTCELLRCAACDLKKFMAVSGA